MLDPLIDAEPSHLLRGVRNALVIAVPFWCGLIYWLTR